MSNNHKQQKNKKNLESIFTAETLGVVLMLFSTLCLVCLITYDKVFSTLGKYVSEFLCGVFGYSSILVFLSTLVLGLLLLFGKKINIIPKYKMLFTLIVCSIALLINTASMSEYISLNYGEYLSTAYTLGEGGLKGSTCGGVILSLVSFLIASLLTNVGAYVVCSIIIALLIYCIVKDVYTKKAKIQSEPKLKTSYVKREETQNNITPTEERDYPVENVDFSESANTSNQRLFINNPNEFALKTKREIKKDNGKAIKIDYSSEGLGIGNSVENSYQNTYAKDMESKLSYIKTPANLDISKSLPKRGGGGSVRISRPIKDFYNDFGKVDKIYTPEVIKDEHIVDVESENNNFEDIPLTIHEENNIASASDHARQFSRYANIPENEVKAEAVEPTFTFHEIDEPLKKKDTFERQVIKEEKSFESVEKFEDKPIDVVKPDFSNDRLINKNISKENQIENVIDDEPPISNVRETSRSVFGNIEDNASNKAVSFDLPSSRSERQDIVDRSDRLGRQDGSFLNEKPVRESVPEPPKNVELPKKPKVAPPINRVYHRPPLDLLVKHDVVTNENAEDHQGQMEKITKTLEDFHINATVEGYVQGPSVTRYEIKMPAGVSVKRVAGLDDDLRMILKSKSGVRIEAPIPGKDLVGIEVANSVKAPVGLREILEDTSKKPSKPGSLMFAIGKDIVGKAITDNLAEGPHYLVAGSTGSGKSVCLNVMIVSMIMRYSPEDLRLILIDPKSVEFGIYEHLPHLMSDEIITEPRKAVGVLQWAYNEMEKRYAMFRECEGRIVDINSYNEKIASATVARMPRIVIIIDELADLMITCKKEMDAKIQALAQKSRAVGIHLVLATQRPSVDVITGTIKTNLPSRIALKVMNAVDSGTILGEGGAEKLLGHGDMLYRNSTMGENERYQGAYLTDSEIMSVVDYIKEHNKSYFDDELSEFLENTVRPKQEEVSASDDAPSESGIENSDIFIKSLALAITLGQISISLLQRRFQIGYAKAGGIVDKMERKRYIAPNENNGKGRKVLITKEEFEKMYGDMPEDL